MFVKVVLISERDNTFCRQLEINESNHGEEIITKCISDMIAHLGFTGLTEIGNLRQRVSLPHINASNVLAGVEINLSIRIVHYIILQGLGLTQDWKQTDHENASFVSSVHLRNMSHMALGIMGLLLHVSVDKCHIPANDGLIWLPFPSPGNDSKIHRYSGIVNRRASQKVTTSSLGGARFESGGVF